MPKQTMEDATHSKASGGLKPGRAVPLAVIAVGFAVFYFLGGYDYLSFSALSEHREILQSWYAENAVAVTLGFCVFYTLAVACSLPGAIWLTLLGGFMFGTWMGTLYVVLSATTGAVLIFLAARYALGDFFRSRAGGVMQKMEDGFRENAVSYLLVLRLIPVFPFWLVNLVPALQGMPVGAYTFATFIGIIPGSFVYCSVGSGLGVLIESGQEPDLGIIFQPDILLPLIGLALLSLVPVVYKKLKRDKPDAQGNAVVQEGDNDDA